ncbi:MAG: phosphoribosylglycinamide formyltransferase [Chloroflexi bacterium]|nr:phosphoribosylglycinamide formyltransferase [Chloroflexota bacterium]
MVILRLGVLASHGGTNLQAIVDACKEGRLDASVSVVISNNSSSMALERANREDIPSYHVSAVTHPLPHDQDGAILNALKKHDVDLVILAGYMKLLGPLVLQRYRNRILNSHPALLPKFGGRRMYGRLVHEAVLTAKEDVTGVTIHLADDVYDHGPIVAQCQVPVVEGDTVDTLMDRVQKRERLLWVETLQSIVRHELDLDTIG